MNTRTQYLDEPHGKYTRTNIITRRLIGCFFDAVRELTDMTGASSALEVGCGEGFSTRRLRAILPPDVPFEASDVEGRAKGVAPPPVEIAANGRVHCPSDIEKSVEGEEEPCPYDAVAPGALIPQSHFRRAWVEV